MFEWDCTPSYWLYSISNLFVTALMFEWDCTPSMDSPFFGQWEIVRPDDPFYHEVENKLARNFKDQGLYEALSEAF